MAGVTGSQCARRSSRQLFSWLLALETGFGRFRQPVFDHRTTETNVFQISVAEAPQNSQLRLTLSLGDQGGD